MNTRSNASGLTLAFDTSSHILDIVLTDGNESSRYTADAGRRHNELLATSISDLLGTWPARSRQLSRVICCRGPGSFTGLRIGIATAKGIAAAHRIPVYAVPTLTAYRIASPNELVISAIDGRKNRFYVEIFDGSRSLFGPVDAESERVIEAIQSLEMPALRPFPIGDGRDIHVVGPDSTAFIRNIASRSPEFANRLKADSSYLDGVANALVSCVRSAEDEKRFRLDDASGPDYLRPSQAEESA